MQSLSLRTILIRKFLKSLMIWGDPIRLFLSKDIRKKNKRSDMKITYAYHDKAYTLDNDTEVDTLLSNDSGVAFIVKTREGTIYHAGDLNDWYWEGEPED